MEFWGIEVEAGKPVKVEPELGKLIHISQVTLGEVKDVKAAKNVPLRLKVDGKNFVFGYLSAEGTTQIMVDLVFDREFELSHDLKNGSVYCLGYTADEQPSDDEFPEFDDDESEDDLVNVGKNGNVKPSAGDVKAAKNILAAAGKPKAEAKKEEASESDDDDDEDDSDSGSEMALDGIAQADSDDDSLDGEDDSSDEEELPKIQKSKKRPVEIEQKAPASKKAKSSSTPEKSGNKGKTGTPKASGNKSKDQTPKSAAAQNSCKSCSKTFANGKALESHNKAKHAGK